MGANLLFELVSLPVKTAYDIVLITFISSFSTYASGIKPLFIFYNTNNDFHAFSRGADSASLLA